jgi:hypothetical protein
MKLSYVVTLLVGVILLAFAGVSAQDDVEACPVLVAKALQAVQTACANLGRNQACYGNDRIEALFDEAGDPVTFAQPSDRVPVDSMKSLRTFALDEGAGVWGVAMLNIQANLPDTLPGQGVKFILYGDVSLEQAEGGDDFGPMQAFYLTTNPSKLACREVPPSQLVIQSPKGYKINLNANGMDISIGSTVVLSAEPEKQMTIGTLEGEVVATFEDETQIIPEGFVASVPLGGEDGLTPLDAPGDLEIIDAETWELLADTAGEIWDEPIDIVDTSQWTSIDDFCGDPANETLCATEEFSNGFPDCTDEGCVTDCLLGCTSEADPVCGDLMCSAGEDDTSCPADCGLTDSLPELTCGDNICSLGEDNAVCPGDCPAILDDASATCGDAVCQVGEDNLNCSADCPVINEIDNPPLIPTTPPILGGDDSGEGSDDG